MMTTTNSDQTASAAYVLPEQKEKPAPRIYSKPELLLLPTALLTGILYDRLVLRISAGWALNNGAFWICYLVLFYVFNWAKIKANKILWMISGFITLLCIWNIFFDYNSVYGKLTYIVIPCVCMAHAVLFSSGYKLKQVAALAVEWLMGWFIKPFVGIPHFFGVSGVLLSKEKNSTLKRVMIGIAVTIPLLLIILPLLSGADMIFNLYIGKILKDFSLISFTGHVILTVLFTILFFSFLWNIRFAERKKIIKIKEFQIDLIISGIALGAILLIYMMFCAVQFTYLFAGAGLPEGMTYSEYAREGFWQLIMIAGINLILFGIFLCFGSKSKALTAMLALLLAVTGVMIVSGALRLKLYTDTYGLTWLRLISAWFICFIAAVILLCYIRMVKESIPLFAICAFVLLGWYAVLGYANPDALIVRYNIAHSQNQEQWLKDNRYYISYDLSDDAALVILAECPPSAIKDTIISRMAKQSYGVSASSQRVRKIMREKGYYLADDEMAEVYAADGMIERRING